MDFLRDYTDSESEVREFIKDFYQEGFINPDVIYPDPQAKYVWLALDSKKKKAVIIYLNQKDFDFQITQPHLMPAPNVKWYDLMWFYHNQIPPQDQNFPLHK